MEELLGQRPRGEAEAYSQFRCGGRLGAGPVGDFDKRRAEPFQRGRTGPKACDEEDLILSGLESWEDCRGVDVETVAHGEVC